MSSLLPGVLSAGAELFSGSLALAGFSAGFADAGFIPVVGAGCCSAAGFSFCTGEAAFSSVVPTGFLLLLGLRGRRRRFGPLRG